MYKLVYSNQFKKDIEHLKKRGYNIELLKMVIISLESNGTLSKEYKPHKLSGN